MPYTPQGKLPVDKNEWHKILHQEALPFGHNSPNAALHLSGPHSIPLPFGVFSSEPSIHPVLLTLPQPLSAPREPPPSACSCPRASRPEKQQSWRQGDLQHRGVTCALQPETNPALSSHRPDARRKIITLSPPPTAAPVLSLTLCLGEWYLLRPAAWEWLPDASIFLIPLHELH